MIAGLVGNGLGILLLGTGWIAMRHLRGGRGWEAWAMRAVIVVMFLGGAALLLTGVGGLLHSVATGILGILGSTGELVVCTLLFLFLLAEVVMGLWRHPGKAAAMSAVFLAFTLTLPLAGAPAQLASQLSASANQYASVLGSKLGV
jgi:hypothetical protein